MDHTARSALLNSETTQSSRLRCARVPLYERSQVLGTKVGIYQRHWQQRKRRQDPYTEVTQRDEFPMFASGIRQETRLSIPNKCPLTVEDGEMEPCGENRGNSSRNAPVKYKQFWSQAHESLCKWASDAKSPSAPETVVASPRIFKSNCWCGSRRLVWLVRFSYRCQLELRGEIT